MDMTLPEGARGRALAVALTITVLAVLWLGCAQPLFEWYVAGDDMLQQRRALLQRMTALVGMLPELRSQASGERAPVSLLEGASDAIAAATLQSAVQAMATSAGAALSSMETLPAEQRGGYHRIGLRVATAAPWPVLVELLRQIEQGTPRMLIDDVQLRASPVELRAATSPITAAFTVFAFRTAAPGNNG